MAEKTAKKVASSRHTGDGSKSTTERAAAKHPPPARHTGNGSKSATGQRAAKRPPPVPKSNLTPRRSTAPLAPPIKARAALAARALPELPQPVRGDKINLGIVAGSDGPTGWLGAGATDLCEISPGGQVALAGDTFTGNRCREGDWSPSLGLHVKPGTLGGKVEFDHSFGWCSLYAEGWPPGGSQLPAGTVQVFGIDYALITRTVDDLIPIDSRLVRIDPNRGYWPTVPGSLRDAGWEGGNQTQISGCQAPDGWVYIVADGFARDHTVRLYHCHAEHFEDRNMWWAWGKKDGIWQWDVDPEPLSGDIFGELSLRIIEEKFVLSGFNARTGCTEVRVADDVTQVLAGRTPMTVVADPISVPNNYGGYIVPGSTLDQALILVSQWCPGDYPYRVQEFVVNLNR